MNTKMLRQSHGCVGKHQSCTAAFYCLVPRRSGQTTDFRVRQLAPSHSASLRHYWVSGSKGQNKLRANKDKDRNNPKANNKHLKDRQGARRWWCMPLSLAGGSLSLRPLVYRASSRTEDVDGGGGMTWDRGKKHLAERRKQWHECHTAGTVMKRLLSTDSPEREWHRHINAVLLTEERHEHLSKGRVIADAWAPVLQLYSQRAEPADCSSSTCQGRQRDGNSELTLGQ